MKSYATLSGVLTTLFGLASVSYLLVADADFVLIEWPYEAFQSLVFSIVWGFGVSKTVGYVYSALIVTTIAVVSFAIGHKLHRLVVKP